MIHNTGRSAAGFKSLTSNKTGTETTVIDEAKPTKVEYWLGFADILNILNKAIPMIGVRKPPQI